MNRKLFIENPCSENWESMKIGIYTRFCDHCSKEVVDFTEMEREQILEYLLLNFNKQVCGRIKASQLDFSDYDFFITIEALSKKSKNSNLSFYLLAIGSLLLAGCGNELNQYKKTSPSHLEVKIKQTSNVNESVQPVSKEKNRSKNQYKKTRYIVPTVIDSFPQPIVEEFMGLITHSSPVDSNVVVIECENKVENIQNIVYFVVDKMPEFIGGLDSLSSFVKRNLIYPEWGRKYDIQGKAYVRFTIDKTGKVINPFLLRSFDDHFDKEVFRIVELMPYWIPGEQANQKVDVYFTMPIVFKLD